MKASVKKLLEKSIPPEEYDGEYTLTANVIDFINNREKTFSASVLIGERELRDSDFIILEQLSSVKFKNNITNLKKEMRKVKVEVESDGIPTSIVSSPWRIPSKSYVANDLKDYIKNNVAAAILTTKLQNYAQVLGLINTPLPNIFRVNLDAGGYVEVEINAAAGLTFDVNIKKVVDSDNNTLPIKKEDMNYQSFRVSPDAAYIEDLNALMIQWGLSNRKIFNGSVKIHDLICDDKGCECPDCPEGKNP